VQWKHVSGVAAHPARAQATAVQRRAVSTGAYDSKPTDYEQDFGGYKITVHKETAEIFANAGTKCGTWTPMTFSLTL
jgi:hypothetical protein